jgi:cell division transport system permease protein
MTSLGVASEPSTSAMGSGASACGCRCARTAVATTRRQPDDRARDRNFHRATAGFLVLLKNLETVTGGWEGSPRISLFLHEDVSRDEAEDLAESLARADDVMAVESIDPDTALAEFRQLSGLDSALDLLDENPLPEMLVILPTPGLAPGTLGALRDELAGLSPVEQARLDLEWVQRLDALMDLIRRGVWLVALLLAISVLLVVGNTVRLAIENRRDEIVIIKLIGATDGFIRRPFLYEGLWYGLAGGLLAAALVETGRFLLIGPADRLAALYQSGMYLQGLGVTGVLYALCAGVLLGLTGSWLALARHLAAIEPR